MDAFGHINNTVYFRYFENARIEYFNRIGVAGLNLPTGKGPILANTRCNFRIPLEYPDHIHTGIRCRVLSPKKFSMEFAVFSDRHGAIAAEGEGLIVYYDYASGKSCEIPDAIVAAIKKLEA
jgi:acyl-CoA thioester hydrolase